MQHQRIRLQIGLALVSVIGGLYAVSSLILLRNFTQLEQQNTQRTVEQAIDVLSNDLTELNSTAGDYAVWDDTYRFIQDGNPEFVRLYLNESTFSSLDLDFIVLVNTSHHIVFGERFNTTTKTSTPLPASLQYHLTHHTPLLQHQHPDSSLMGFLSLPEGFLMIVSRPIVTSEGKGPIRGSLLMARYLDEAERKRLEKRVQSSLKIYPFNTAQPSADFQKVRSALLAQPILIQPLDSNLIAGYGLLQDIYGKAELVLQVNAPRNIHQRGLLSVYYLGVSLLVLGMAAGLIIRLLLRQLVKSMTERDRMEQALRQEALLRQSEVQYREKAQELEQTLHELKQTQAQLVQTEKMSSLGQLVAGVAHEINNPIGFIAGNLTYAEQYIQDLVHLLKLYQQQYPHPTPEMHAAIAAIDSDFLIADLPKLLISMRVGSDRIKQLVLSLRNFSRQDEAEMKLVDIHQGIDNTLMLLQSQLTTRAGLPDIKIVKEYGDLPLVECYAGQLNQVVMNLLTNAIDALELRYATSYRDQNTEQNGAAVRQPDPCIWICTEQLHQQIAIRVIDNGMGMTESVKLRLFDPFFTTKEIGKGTGLGLAISYRIIVEKHHGQIQCISAPGRGAEFVVQIPIQQRQQAIETYLAKPNNPLTAKA
jgi:signal transduction histidine kinase